jgi:hypothetical protein
MRKTFSVYSIVVGAGIFAAWTVLLLAGAVGRLYSGTGYPLLHIVGEYATSLALLVSGVGCLLGRSRFRRLNDAAAGMLIILTLHAFNSYLYLGDPVMAGGFLAITLATIVLYALSLRTSD